MEALKNWSIQCKPVALPVKCSTELLVEFNLDYNIKMILEFNADFNIENYS